jgi:hypothetical protein
MKAVCSFETSVDFQRTTWRYMPEDNHRSEKGVFKVIYCTVFGVVNLSTSLLTTPVACIGP